MNGMKEVKLIHYKDHASGVTYCRYDIPEGIDPNRGSKLLPNTPLLIQVITIGDYNSALKLITEFDADVNVTSTEISQIGGNKPSNHTPLTTLIGTLKEISNQHTNSMLEMFLPRVDTAIKVLNLLLEKGANVNHQDCMGFTALHLLINNNKIEANTKLMILELLLKYGADKTIEMPKYGTAKDLAKLIELDTIQPEIYVKL
jgi:ankyrin repeat protein